MLPTRPSEAHHLRPFKVFDEIPLLYEAPAALKVVCLKPTWKFAYIECLAHEVGCKYQGVTATLVKKRKEKAKIHGKSQKELEKKTDRCTEVLKTNGLLI